MLDSHPTNEELEDYSRYRDGEVPERLAAVEEHIRTCERCREHVAEVNRVTEAVKQLLKRNPGPEA